MSNTLKDKLVPTKPVKPTNTNFKDSPWCAYDNGKQEWKKAGNYYTATELEQLQRDCDVTLTRPVSRVLSAD